MRTGSVDALLAIAVLVSVGWNVVLFAGSSVNGSYGARRVDVTSPATASRESLSEDVEFGPTSDGLGNVDDLKERERALEAERTRLERRLALVRDLDPVAAAASGVVPLGTALRVLAAAPPDARLRALRDMVAQIDESGERALEVVRLAREGGDTATLTTLAELVGHGLPVGLNGEQRRALETVVRESGQGAQRLAALSLLVAERRGADPDPGLSRLVGGAALRETDPSTLLALLAHGAPHVKTDDRPDLYRAAQALPSGAARRAALRAAGRGLPAGPGAESLCQLAETTSDPELRDDAAAALAESLRAAPIGTFPAADDRDSGARTSIVPPLRDLVERVRAADVRRALIESARAHGIEVDEEAADQDE